MPQGKTTRGASAAKLLPTLLKLAVRGSLKARSILLTIALLVAINVAAHTMASSYEKQVTSLMALYSGREYLTVSETPTPGSIKVSVSPYNWGDRRILLIHSESLKALLSLSGATVSGVLPSKADEALVGESIKHLAENGRLYVDGLLLKVTGSVRSSDHLTYSIISLAKLRVDAQQFFVSLGQGENGVSCAPAAQSVSKSLFMEVLNIISSVRLLMYAILGLSCLFQGYNSLVEAEHVLRVFASLGAPRRSFGGSMFLYACLVSLSGAMVGFSIGLFTSGLLSSLTSVIFHMSHLKPFVGPGVASDLALGVASSLPTLFFGLFRGYSKQIATG